MTRRGQNMIEYATLLAIVVGALITMQIYVKRGIMGRQRKAVDSIGSQYQPRGSTANLTTTIHADTTRTSMASWPGRLR